MTLTMRSFPQPVAAGGNGFRLIRPLSRLCDLRAFATRCNHGAP
jgi:hypothetical protein